MPLGSDVLDPLRGPPPTEVPLVRAPLVRVLAQVRFTELLSIEQAEQVAGFQTAIAADYPVLHREAGMAVTIPAPGFMPAPRSVTLWRFADAPTHWQWRATLTSEFVSLEVTRYTSRSEFFARLRKLLEALQLHIRPAQVLRLGVRYVNRIVEPELAHLADLIRPEISGVVGTPMVCSTHGSGSETLFTLHDGVHMAARWGLMPAQVVLEPSAYEPVDGRSFVLDLDVYDERPMPLDAHAIAERGKDFAQRSYAFFRWAVTDEFLRCYGGTA